MSKLGCRLLSPAGAFVVEDEILVDTANQAMQAVRARYEPMGFTKFKTVEEDDGFRITATTPNGRAGRNLAFCDWTYEEL
jgi:hypothetical protein